MKQLFNMSRGASGSRTLASMLKSEGFDVGRFKVRKLMQEAELISKQPGSHRYKQAKLER
ncbi:IS3 family transposase, partial [Vibrio coralliilyticus]